MATQTHNSKLEQKRAERTKKDSEDSPSEKREVVMHGAKLKCEYAQGLGDLVVTSNELQLQDKLWATQGDGNNMINLQFKGTCGHPKWPAKNMQPPPCMSVIKLSPWEKLGTTIVQDQRVLVKESCITCNPDFNSAKASPIPQVASIETKLNKILNFDRLTPLEIDLFDLAKFKVTQYENPPTVADKQSVKWQIDYGTNKQDIFNHSEELNLRVGDKDCYDTTFKVFAYMQNVNENLFKEVRVKPITIIPRSSWGARTPRTGGNYSYEAIGKTPEEYYDTIVIHHSGNAKHFPTVKEIQDEHMDQMDKADIGYHFAVDKDGKIYEGRVIDRKGAHVDQANTGKIGVVLLGDLSTDNVGVNQGILGAIKLNFEERDGDDHITDKMRNAVLSLCIHLDRLYKIEMVGGHMEIASSSHTDERYCPGNLTMEKMDEWRQILEKKKP